MGIFTSLLVVLTVSSQLHAQLDKLNVVKVEKTIQQSFETFKAKSLQEQWAANLASQTSGIYHAEVFASGSFLEEKQSDPKFIKNLKSSWITLETLSSALIGENLVKIDYVDSICKAGVADCVPNIKIEVTGPKKSYRSVVPVFHRLQPELLDNSVVLKIEATPSGTNTKVAFILEFKNRNFHQFFKQLEQKKMLIQIPSEKDLQASFESWANERFSELAKGG